jgi:hypothetical protein
MVKAVMVYIKVVLKPPSASTQLRSYPGKPKKKYVYQEEQERNKKRDKNIQSEASNNIESGIKSHQEPRVYITRTSFSHTDSYAETTTCWTTPLGNGFT